LPGTGVEAGVERVAGAAGGGCEDANDGSIATDVGSIGVGELTTAVDGNDG